MANGNPTERDICALDQTQAHSRAGKRKAEYAIEAAAVTGGIMACITFIGGLSKVDTNSWILLIPLLYVGLSTGTFMRNGECAILLLFYQFCLMLYRHESGSKIPGPFSFYGIGWWLGAAIPIVFFSLGVWGTFKYHNSPVSEASCDGQLQPTNDLVFDHRRKMLPKIAFCPCCRTQIKLNMFERIRREYVCPICDSKAVPRDEGG